MLSQAFISAHCCVPRCPAGQGVFFLFVVAPFCSCPASWVSRKFFAVGPGVQSVFFWLRSVGRLGGARAKKNTTQGVFFLLRPGERQGEGEAPLGAGTGPEQKKTPPRVFFFFCSGLGRRHGARAKKKKTPPRVLFFFAPAPGKGRGRRSPLGASRGQSKKKTPPRVFFCSGPGERQGKEKPRWAPARGQSKKKHQPGCFFFAPALGAGTGPEQKKNTTQGVFFFCSGPGARGRGRRSFVGRRRRARAKKKHHPGCFFLCSGLGRRRGAREPKKNTTQG